MTMSFKPVLNFGAVLAAVLPVVVPRARGAAGSNGVIDIGDRRQLFVDDTLIAQESDLTLELHRPQSRGIVVVFDQPWEGSETCYQRIIRVGNVIRMYYVGGQDVSNREGTEMNDHANVACVALSVDGVHWVRPDLDLVPFDGAVEFNQHGWIEHPIPRFNASKHNNIIWSQPRLDNFTPFRDTNPACPPDERYKAVGYADPMAPDGPRELYAYKSADGIHWSYLSRTPILSSQEERGLAFDSENNAFWDPVRKCYWCYVRGYHFRTANGITDVNNGTPGVRDIRVSTSPDFRTWTRPRLLKFDGPYAPALYTNQIEPYYRDPEVFVGFPARYSDRVKDFTPAAIAALPDPVNRANRMKFNPRYGTVVTDTLLVTSRDGYTYHLWPKAFILPGLQREDTWAYHDIYQSLGLLETPAKDPTAPPELSFYVTEAAWIRAARLRRYTMRIDGFVSVHASLLSGGEFVTKPLTFSGRRLSLNVATSSAGTVRVELDDGDGNPYPGFAKADCDPIFGDTLDRSVTWRDQSDVGSLAGKPVRIRMFLDDADLYSLEFCN